MTNDKKKLASLRMYRQEILSRHREAVQPISFCHLSFVISLLT